MRLRHIPGSEEAIATSPYVVRQPQQYQGKFCELFANSNPIEIEIGMGKGKFIMELAKFILGLSDIPVFFYVRLRNGRRWNFPIFISCVWMQRL